MFKRVGGLIGKAKDLTEMKFGRLKVIKKGGMKEDPYQPGHMRTFWFCKCDCGNPELLEIFGNRLQSGKLQSCGCLIRDCQRKTNIYDLTGEYGIGYTENTDSYGRNEFYFDLEDYDKIKNNYWSFNKNDYLDAWGHKQHDGKITLILHRIIMGDPDGYKIDHIHGSSTKNDNRKCNLRIATNQQNTMNSKMHSNNTSGVTGVSWDSRSSRWVVQIGYKMKRIHVGYYDNFDDAVVARKNAEEKYFGEWSYDNSQNYHIENDYDVKRDEPAC